MYTEFTRELAEPRWAAAWNALFIELREPAAVSPAAPLPAWAASLAESFQKGFTDACYLRGFPAAFSVVAGTREGTLRVRGKERVQEWVYRMWAKTAAGADGVGRDRDATHMGEGAERGLGRSAAVADARGQFWRSLGADGRRRGAAGAGGRGRHGCRCRRGREGGRGVLLAVRWRAGRDHRRGEVACILFSRRAAPR